MKYGLLDQRLADAECELIDDMQSSLAIKYLYENESLTQIWGSEDYKKFSLLQFISLQYLSMFGTTY